jgi:hypothetical protein
MVPSKQDRLWGFPAEAASKMASGHCHRAENRQASLSLRGGPPREQFEHAMNYRLVLASGALLLLAACETAPAAGPSRPAPAAARPAPQAAAPAPAPPPAAGGNMAFSTADFAWSTKPGKGSIQGQVGYKISGKTFVCSENGVILSPETPWVRRRMEILYQSGDHATQPAADVRARTPPERNTEYEKMVKRAQCDATGHFMFDNLPDGAWYVISVIRAAPNVSAGEMAVMRRVVIRGGNVARVTL